MEIEQQNQLNDNKYIEFIKKYKYNVYFIGAIVILFSMIIVMIALIANSSTKKSSNPTKNTSQKVFQSPSSVINISPSSSTISIMTPNPTQAAVIENQTQPQITPYVTVPYTVSNITQYGDNWATMNITNPDIGGGAVIVQKVNGTWKVVLGPGSSFSPDQLQPLGAPQALINSFNTSPSSSLSPSQ
jgi:hypothetical protein